MSASGIPVLTTTVSAQEEEVAKNRFVNANGFYASSGGTAFGISQYKVKKERPLAVTNLGIAYVEVASPFELDGDGTKALEVGEEGKGISHSSGTVVARALQPAATAGSLVKILIIQN